MNAERSTNRRDDGKECARAREEEEPKSHKRNTEWNEEGRGRKRGKGGRVKKGF